MLNSDGTILMDSLLVKDLGNETKSQVAVELD
jgi:hypothetical protein